MRRFIALVLLLATGCANYSISASSGTAVASGANGVYVSTTGGPAVLFMAMMFGMIASPEAGRQPPPEMSPVRSINEQDCTRPVSATGNLKCR